MNADASLITLKQVQSARRDNYTWFQKFLAFVWMFGFVFLVVGAFTSQTTTFRQIDGGLGILSNPVSEGSSLILKSLLTPIGVQACGDPCPSIILNINALLNDSLKKAFSALVNQILGQVMNLFDQLLSSIQSAIQGFDGLADVLGSFRAAIALKSQQISENLNETAGQFVDRVFPQVTDATQKQVVEAAVLGHDMSVAINQSQQGVAAPLPNTPTTAQIATNDSKIAAVASSTCVRPDVPLAQLLGVECGAAVTESSSVQTALAQRDSQRHDTLVQTQAALDNQAPANCKGKGFLNFSSDVSLTPSTGTTSAASFTDATTFKTATQTFVSTFDPKVLNTEQCNNLDRGPAALAAAQASANQSSNEFDFDSILKTFIDAISKFFTQLIQSVLNVVTQAISGFISQVPGGRYFSQALGDLTGTLLPTINQQLTSTLNSLLSSASPAATN